MRQRSVCQPIAFSQFLAILSLLLLSFSVRAQTPIVYGQSIADTISPATEVEKYSIVVAAGDILWVRVSPVSSSVNVKLEIFHLGVLFDVKSTNSFGVMVESRKVVPMNGGGVYDIFVSDVGANNTGRFCISVERFNTPPTSKLLNCDGSLNSNIECNSSVRAFRYSVKQNAISRIVVAPTSSSVNPKVWICTPEGIIVAQDSTTAFGQPVTLQTTATETGCIYVFVGDTGGNNTGAFSISHSLLFGECATDCSTVETGEPNFREDLFLKSCPNPAINKLFVSLPQHSGIGYGTLTIFDSAGRVVLTHKPTDVNTRLDVAALPSGFYFLQLQVSDGTIRRGSFVKN